MFDSPLHVHHTNPGACADPHLLDCAIWTPQFAHAPGAGQRALDLAKGCATACTPKKTLQPNQPERWKRRPSNGAPCSSYAGSRGYPWSSACGPRAIPLPNDDFASRAAAESRLLGIDTTESRKKSATDAPSLGVYAAANPPNYRINVCDLNPVSTRTRKWMDEIPIVDVPGRRPLDVRAVAPAAVP